MPLEVHLWEVLMFNFTDAWSFSKFLGVCALGCVGITVAGVLGLIFLGTVDSSLSSTLEIGKKECIAVQSTVRYQLDHPSKVISLLLSCGDEVGGRTALFANQPVLDLARVGDSFLCERYLKKSWSGWFRNYYYYQQCAPHT